jgi:hypothetical protein
LKDKLCLNLIYTRDNFKIYIRIEIQKKFFEIFYFNKKVYFIKIINFLFKINIKFFIIIFLIGKILFHKLFLIKLHVKSTYMLLSTSVYRDFKSFSKSNILENNFAKLLYCIYARICYKGFSIL